MGNPHLNSYRCEICGKESNMSLLSCPDCGHQSLKRFHSVLDANKGILVVGLIGLGTGYFLLHIYGPITAAIGGCLAGATVMATWERRLKDKIIFSAFIGLVFVGAVWLLKTVSRLPLKVMLIALIIMLVAGFIGESLFHRKR